MRVVVAALLAMTGTLAGAPSILPIHIEESHAGSFYFLAETLDLDEVHALVLVDAHSDASGILRSDDLREKLRRVVSPAERVARLDEWRRDGVVQCFDWIEPLMPRPIAEVFWIAPGDAMTRGKAGVLARLQLDAHEEAEPRAAGAQAAHYHVVDWKELAAALPPGMPVVASIDLDAFSGGPADRLDSAVDETFSRVLQIPGLRAVTVALSRPYLASDEEADALLAAALRNALDVANAEIHFEPLAPGGEDRSRKAREYRGKGQPVPRFDLAKAGPKTRAMILEGRERWKVRFAAAAWSEWLETVAAEDGVWKISVTDGQPSADGVWRMAAPARPSLRVSGGDGQPPSEVRWSVVAPEFACYNVKPEATKGFAEGAPGWIRFLPRPLATTHGMLPLPYAEWSAGLEEIGSERCGSVRVRADIVTADGELRKTAQIEIRRAIFDGVRGAVTEQFGLPYVYGSTWLAGDSLTGAECGWGADCANFVIGAARRNGFRWAWGNPVQLRERLEPIARTARLDGAGLAREEKPVVLSKTALAEGVVVHLDSHVGVVLEDRPPLGVLSAEDRIAHQLEDFPRVLPLGEFVKKAATFGVWKVPKPGSSPIRLAVVGDIMPGRAGEREALADQAAGIPGIEQLREADVAVANLEGAVTRGGAARATAFTFVGTVSSLETIRRLGIDALSLANNHAMDAGPAGLGETRELLAEFGLGGFGAGANVDFATEPWKSTCRGTTLAFFGVCLSGPPEIEAGESQPGVAGRAALPLILSKISKARREGCLVIVVPHWGTENTDQVTEDQRELARRFVEAGADGIAGSHPHVVQPLDRLAGAPIFYSLGNFLFDQPEGGPFGSGGIGWIEIHRDAAHFPASLERIDSPRSRERR